MSVTGFGFILNFSNLCARGTAKETTRSSVFQIERAILSVWSFSD